MPTDHMQYTTEVLQLVHFFNVLPDHLQLLQEYDGRRKYTCIV